MKNKSLRKSKRFTIRLTPSEDKCLRIRAKCAGKSISDYMISCSDEEHSRSKMHHIKRLKPYEARALERIVSVFYASVNKCYQDYSNAFDNLEHDNNMMNHGKLAGLPKDELRRTFLAVKRNQQNLKKMRNSLNRMEMMLYDY